MGVSAHRKQTELVLRHEKSNFDDDSGSMSDPAAAAASSGSTTIKKTALWSVLLPPTATHEHASNEPPLPTTSPADRNAHSIKLMLGDAKTCMQQLSDRVDKMLDLHRVEANKLEQVIGGIVQSVERAFTAVAESNAAHTSKLDEALTRCARLEHLVVAQSKAIDVLGAKYNSLPNEFKLLSAETKNWLGDHAKESNMGLDRVRDQVERVRESWDAALSVHRQETSVMFSAVLAGIRNLSDSKVNLERVPETSRSGLAHTLDTTSPTHGPRSSSDVSPTEHAAKKNTTGSGSARHSQPGAVHGKNSTHQSSSRVVEDTQSTALSSLPDEPASAETGGFGTLNKRTSSAFTSFTNPGSPQFMVQHRPFVPAQNSQPPNPAPGTPAPTLGRSSPNENAHSSLKKRSAGVQDAPPAKRQRGRKLLSSQELLTID